MRPCRRGDISGNLFAHGERRNCRRRPTNRLHATMADDLRRGAFRGNSKQCAARRHGDRPNKLHAQNVSALGLDQLRARTNGFLTPPAAAPLHRSAGRNRAKLPFGFSRPFSQRDPRLSEIYQAALNSGGRCVLSQAHRLGGLPAVIVFLG
jgi:hypothetical protein